MAAASSFQSELQPLLIGRCGTEDGPIRGLPKGVCPGTPAPGDTGRGAGGPARTTVSPLWRTTTCQKSWAERGKQDACVHGPQPWGQLSSARLPFQTSNKVLFLHFQGF